MSSRDSPALTFDVSRRLGDRYGWPALLGLTTLLVCLGASQSLSLAALLGLAALPALCWTWYSERSNGRLTRVSWLPDGRWMLQASHGPIEASLRPDSRFARHYVWLRWDADVRRSVLMLPGDLAEADLRRLVVRLKVEGCRREHGNIRHEP
jgi:hypothetical protein